MVRPVYVRQAGGIIEFKDGASDADIAAYIRAKYPTPTPVTTPAPQPANDASWYGSAIDGAQGRLQAGLGGVSEAVGLEGLAKYLYDASRANDEEAAKYDWGNTDIWNAPSLWEGAKAAGKSIGQSLPDLAGSMAAAGVGAKVGAAAGTLGGPFAEITVPAGAAIGGIGGALGYYFTSNTGANLQEQVKENGGDLESADEGRAMAGAAIQAPLDVLADKVALKRFFPGVSKEIEKALIGSTITRAAVHGVKSAGVGGVTEALQQAIQIGQANPDKLWSMSPEVQGELIDAAIAGGLFEGIVGGITGGADPAADIGTKRKERELETDIKAEAMAGQEEATNAQVLRAVETLIAKQASGPVQIQFSGTTPDGESATTPKYVVKDAGGNEIVSTTTYPAAVKAVSEYKRKTGAKIEVVDNLSDATFKPTPYKLSEGDTKILDAPGTFKTAKGSSYTLHEDGTTTRNKAYRPEHGAKEQGPQPRSEATFFVKPEDAQKLAVFQATAPYKMAVQQMQDGNYAVRIMSGPDAGKWMSGTVVQPQSVATGLTPVETWKDGTRVHFGNAITEIATPADKIFSRENPKNPADPNPPEATSEEGAKEEIPSPIVNDMVDENGVPIYTTSFEGQQEGVTAAVPDEAVTNDEISDEPFPAPEPKPVVEKPAPDLTMGDKIIDTPPTRIEITPEERKRQDEQYKAIYTAVKARLNSTGFGRFIGGLNLVPTLSETTSSSAPRGSFTVDKGKPVINLAYGIYDPALTTDQLVKKVVGVLNHEIIHGLRATGFFSPSEWNTLVRAVKTTQYQGKKYTYFDRAKATYAKMADGMSGKEADDYFAEEAVAELYRDWTSDAKAAPKQVRGLMNRILQFFRGVFKGMRAAKYEPVFERAESAEKNWSVAEDVGPKFSMAPPTESDEFKTWFSGSKMVNPDGTPKRFFHGTSKDKIFDSFNAGQRGIWFTESPDEASMYAKDNDSKQTMKAITERLNTADRVIPAYLSIKNPYKLTEADEKFLRNTRSYVGSQRDLFARIKSSPEKYDGIDWGHGIMIAFSPEQVKSVFNDFAPGTATSKKFSLAPGMEEGVLPDVISKGNEKLFAPFQAEKPLGQRIKSFFTGGEEYKNATAALFGGASVGRVPMAIRVAMVDSHAQLLELEKKANKSKAIKGATGEEERLNADYSVYASFNFAERAGHFTAYAAHKGNIEVVTPDGTIDSAHAKVAESEDNISNIIGILTPERDGKRVSLFDAFRSYAVAKRGQTLEEIDGKLVPVQLDAAYRNTALKEIPRLYPEVIQAYDMYQRMNGRILEAAEKSGLISKETRSNWADKMNYYAFYREMEDDFFAQPVTAAPGSKIDIKKYKGSKLGNLASDPITVMLHNMHFWNASIMKNIASRKAFNLMEAMGEARPLSGIQSPSFEAGEVPQTFHYRVNGVDKRYAVKDHLLATSLRFNERMDFGIFSKILGLPTHWLRESVTRDPRFMITNLMRDTLASWVVRGENTIPIVDSVRGFKKALSKDNVSMRALMAFGVSGQYDKSMMTAEEMSKTLKLEHENVSEILQGRHLGAGMKMIWRTLGKWSDASDAASRIPIYENVLKETGNEAEAAFRALEVLNFSRRGSSRALSLFTQAIPFLNARIQGFDVMYQGGKSAYRYATGKGSAMDARIGRAFLVRGMMLAGIAMALEALQGEDEDYKNLPDYIKDSNILVKVPGTSKFVSWPKPFEVGLLFMTIPQHAVRIGMGNASTAEATKMFTSQVANTFAVNPIPQFAAPMFENFYNHDFFTGQPVVSEGKERLEPFMQYDSRTSAISRMLGEMINYSPAKIENLITGWGGPMGSYLLYVGSTLLNGTLNEMGSGVQTLPTDVSNWPMVRAIMVDAETKNPQVVTTAYEMYRDVDTVNRTLSRLKKSGDVEAVRAYVEDNRGILKAKAPVMKIAEALNNIAAQERRIERNTTMTREQKLEAMRKLREMKLRVTQNVPKIREMMDQ